MATECLCIVFVSSFNKCVVAVECSNATNHVLDTG